MTKFHISKDGVARRCSAQTPASCRATSNDHKEHYETEKEAVKSIEKSLAKEHEFLTTFTKKSKTIVSEPFPKYDNEDEEEFYDKLRKDIGTFVYQGQEFALQPDDNKTSTIYCISCNSVLPKDHVYFTNKRGAKCDECGSKLSGDFDIGILFSQDSLKFLNDDTVRETKWYHTTQNPNWEQSLHDNSRGFLHVGTEQAAKDRCKTLLNDDEQLTYLYEIEMVEDTEIHDHVHYEDPYQDNAPNNESNPEDYKNINFNGATRYMNIMEDPGSISLLINPKKVRVKGVKTIIPESRD